MEWISVKERLPPMSKTVLVRGESYDSSYQDGYVLASWNPQYNPPMWVIGKQEAQVYNVTHWMPLPAPPTV